MHYLIVIEHLSINCLSDEAGQSIHHLPGFLEFGAAAPVPVVPVRLAARSATTGAVHPADRPPSDRRGAG